MELVFQEVGSEILAFDNLAGCKKWNGDKNEDTCVRYIIKIIYVGAQC